jgi:hypothetical protein
MLIGLSLYVIVSLAAIIAYHLEVKFWKNLYYRTLKERDQAYKAMEEVYYATRRSE